MVWISASASQHHWNLCSDWVDCLDQWSIPCGPAGDWTDLMIARNDICLELDPYETFLADGIYSGAHGYSETPTGLNNHDQYMKAVARARHETVNRLFKNYGILRQTFRHSKEDHGRVFLAVANIAQAQLQIEEPSFSVTYNDNE